MIYRRVFRAAISYKFQVNEAGVVSVQAPSGPTHQVVQGVVAEPGHIVERLVQNGRLGDARYGCLLGGEVDALADPARCCCCHGRGATPCALFPELAANRSSQPVSPAVSE